MTTRLWLLNLKKKRERERELKTIPGLVWLGVSNEAV